MEMNGPNYPNHHPDLQEPDDENDTTLSPAERSRRIRERWRNTYVRNYGAIDAHHMRQFGPSPWTYYQPTFMGRSRWVASLYAARPDAPDYTMGDLGYINTDDIVIEDLIDE